MYTPVLITAIVHPIYQLALACNISKTSHGHFARATLYNFNEILPSAHVTCGVVACHVTSHVGRAVQVARHVTYHVQWHVASERGIPSSRDLRARGLSLCAIACCGAHRPILAHFQIRMLLTLSYLSSAIVCSWNSMQEKHYLTIKHRAVVYIL